MTSVIRDSDGNMPSDDMEMNGDVGVENGAETPLRENRRRQRRPLNMNHYANKKSAAESMLDVALLMANTSQLRAVIQRGPNSSFYVPLVTLISISLILQVTVGVLLIFIVKWDLNKESLHHRLNVLENITTAFVFVIVVINIFITAFDVQQPIDSS